MFLPKIWIICRVCLKQQDEVFNIFDDIFEKNIWSFLRDCGGVPVKRNDDLPDKICGSCLRRLWEAIKFRLDCQRRHRELMQMQMKRNAIIYETDLDEQNNYSSEFITISDPVNRSIDSTGNYEELTAYPKENHENIISKTPDSISIENEESNSDIKQYFLVTRNNEKETRNLEDGASDNNKPIVLLFKLKNTPPDENHIDKNIKNMTTERTKLKKHITTKILKKMNTEKTDNSKLKNGIIRPKSKSVVKTDIKSAINPKEAILNCKVCNKIFKTYDQLRHHMYIHKRPHQCKICRKRFSQIQALVSHKNFHNGIKPYCCRICKQTFSDITNRNSHERKRHKKQEFKCDKCNKIFRFQTLLQKHSQSHRSKICLICKKEFSSLQMLRTHHQRKHLKLKEIKNN